MKINEGEIISVKSLSKKVEELYRSGGGQELSPVEIWRKYGYHDLADEYERREKTK